MNVIPTAIPEVLILEAKVFGDARGFFLEFWVPPGFGHGFVVLSEQADFLYKTTEYWYPEYDRRIVWNDPQLAIAWPLEGETPQLAAKDADAPQFAQADVFD